MSDLDECTAMFMQYGSMWYIVNREEILQNIASGLNEHKDKKVQDLVVVLYLSEGTIEFPVADMLDYIANDTYWNEEDNWSNASHARVRVP